MADQDFSVIADDGQANQVSVGLVSTPSSRVISYLLQPDKKENSNFCQNESDPNYLPLVGVRTRRLGEQYPYPAIQGFRSGNAVEVVCYMQKSHQDLPPPARVIAYMQPTNFVDPDGLTGGINTSVAIQGNKAIVGISGNGALGFDQPGLTFTNFAITYDGVEILLPGAASTIHWESDYNSPPGVELHYAHYLEHAAPVPLARYNSRQYALASDFAAQAITASQVEEHNIRTGGDWVKNQALVSRNFSISADDVLSITTQIKNTHFLDITDLYYVDAQEFLPDAVAAGLSTAAHENLSDDLALCAGNHAPIAVGVFCDDAVAHKVRSFLSIPGTTIASHFYNDLYTPGDGNTTSALGVAFYIPSIPVGESVIVKHQIIFGSSKADVMAKAGVTA